MSKLVIHTQYKENYGAHDWDGKGECPQYWKFKGGNTYVVRDLSAQHINKIAEHGIPTLTDLIEYAHEGSMEYILDWEIVDDNAPEDGSMEKNVTSWSSVAQVAFTSATKVWMVVVFSVTEMEPVGEPVLPDGSVMMGYGASKRVMVMFWVDELGVCALSSALTTML